MMLLEGLGAHQRHWREAALFLHLVEQLHHKMCAGRRDGLGRHQLLGKVAIADHLGALGAQLIAAIIEVRPTHGQIRASTSQRDVAQ